jgi:diacylglycerol kinase family enzyme
MEATLIYNQNAGTTGRASVEELTSRLQQAGYKPVYKATSCEDDLTEALAEAAGLVVAAGGDGTVRAVATRLIGRDVALSVLPMGTANNVARTLGIQGDPLELITGLARPITHYFDVGYARAPWGEDYFLEAMGCGLYADILAAYRPEEGKSVVRGLNAFAQTLADYQSRPVSMVVDGRELAGQFVIAELLNTTAFGPRLKVAPCADPGDGLFDLVCIREDNREGLLRYVRGLLTESFVELPSVEHVRGRSLQLEWDGFPLHVDGEVRPPSPIQLDDHQPAGGARPHTAIPTHNTIHVEMLPQAVKFWLPGDSA